MTQRSHLLLKRMTRLRAVELKRPLNVLTRESLQFTHPAGDVSLLHRKQTPHIFFSLGHWKTCSLAGLGVLNATQDSIATHHHLRVALGDLFRWGGPAGVAPSAFPQESQEGVRGCDSGTCSLWGDLLGTTECQCTGPSPPSVTSTLGPPPPRKWQPLLGPVWGALEGQT